MKTQTTLGERYFIYILLATVSVLTLAIFWPFLTVVVLAIAFSVILSPIYVWIKKKITKNISWLASILTLLLFFIVLCVPFFFVGKAVFSQAQDAYSYIINSGSTSNFIQKIDISINKMMPEGFTFDTYGKITELASNLSRNITIFFASTFKTIFLFILMILSIFYLLKDGEHWKKNLLLLIPLSEENAHQIIDTMKSAINRIFKGSFFIAIVQGLIMGIGLTIFGVPNAAIWGVVAGISSFVPTIGTSIVSVPAILYLFFMTGPLYAIGMTLWSMAMVGAIDDILSPYVISRNTNISSLFILFSILGGISLMGPVGIFIGPLIISLLYSLVSIYKKETAIQPTTSN
ncbi:MAG: AI-2E family transporter [Candidatus Pacebacteria bacterium]|nr:AI-2E family transporter [Candidatus Paceibacterota bacterium]